MFCENYNNADSHTGDSDVITTDEKNYNMLKNPNKLTNRLLLRGRNQRTAEGKYKLINIS